MLRAPRASEPSRTGRLKVEVLQGIGLVAVPTRVPTQPTQNAHPSRRNAGPVSNLIGRVRHIAVCQGAIGTARRYI